MCNIYNSHVNSWQKKTDHWNKKENNLENYSRRNNIVIRGIPENNIESNAECEGKARNFFRNELQLNEETVRKMHFVRVHRMGLFQRKNNHVKVLSRPIIVRFKDYADKSMVWAARNKIRTDSLYISENFSAETEFRRRKLYIIYKHAKSLEQYKQKISLNGDILIIDGVRYTVDNLHDLPDDLSPRQFCEKSNKNYLIFGGMVSEYSPFSNWYPCDIKDNGYTFRNLEQVYQYRKAVHCDDRATALKLQYTTNPRTAKELGSKVSGLDGTDWEKKKSDIMLELVKTKFSNPELKAELLKTGKMKLVESGTDRFYASGLPFTSKDMYTPAKWTGKNRLGNILCDVRTYFEAQS